MDNVLSLRKLCLPTAIKNLKSGSYRDHDYKLDDDLSQLVFNILHKPNHPLPVHLAKEIEKKFGVKNMVLGRNNFDESHIDMVRAQTIQKLEIVDLKNEELKSAIRYDYAKYAERGVETVVCDIVLLLKILLNQESREKLDTLKISGNGIAAPRGWIENMWLVVRSIKVLHLNGCDIHFGHLHSIAMCYPHLTELSIGYTEVDCIVGMSNFIELKILCIAGLKFQTFDDLSDIRNLKHLVVLDISSNDGSSNTAELLAASDITFPHLKLLDCSGNSLSDECLIKLSTQHPNLLQIPVLKTKYDRNWDFSHINETVKFLTAYDLAACIESLKYYKNNVPISNLILERMAHFLEEDELEFQTHVDIKKCAILLAGILENYHQNDWNQGIALDCSVSILSDGGIDIFTLEEQKTIAKAVFTALNFAEWTKEDNTDHGFHNAFVGMWLFAETTLLENSILEADMFEMCNAVIQKLVGSDPEMLESCISVIRRLPLPEFSTEESHVKKFYALQLHLLELLKVIDFEEVTDSAGIVWYLMFLYCIVPPENKLINEQYIDLLLTNVTQEWENVYGYMAIYHVLPVLPKETRSRIFNKPNFDNIAERLTDGSDQNRQLRAIDLLLTEYKLVTDENPHPQPFDETEKYGLVGDILYWMLEINCKSDLFCLFDRISKDTNLCIVASWANWIYVNLCRHYM